MIRNHQIDTQKSIYKYIFKKYVCECRIKMGAYILYGHIGHNDFWQSI